MQTFNTLFQGTLNELTQLLQCCSSRKAIPHPRNISLSLYIFIYIKIELILYPSHYLFWNCNLFQTDNVFPPCSGILITVTMVAGATP